MDEKNRIENRIGVLDGIRAIAIGMVVWFHFWQHISDLLFCLIVVDNFDQRNDVRWVEPMHTASSCLIFAVSEDLVDRKCV